MAEDEEITRLLVHESSDSELDVVSSSESESVPGSPSRAQLSESIPDLDSDTEELADVLQEFSEKRRSGASFAKMGLSKLVLTNIQRRGYLSPTPIQRKAIPLILDGHDVVGMARTGSGKTAAFVLPMVEKLREHTGKAGIRALILAPNRELALQSVKAVRDFAKKTSLRTALIVGGDSLDEQFAMMMENPDIVVATPGRFMHLKVEMGLRLMTCEYVVFDEADRLFEMGFKEQLDEIMSSLPTKRQTLLFSATLPPTLIEFARAGLHNPELVRLDAEQKISEDLETAFFLVRDSERDAALLYVLRHVAKVPPMSNEQRAYLAALDTVKKPEPEAGKNELPTPESTIVFVPTKHHVEYVYRVLAQEGWAVSYIYGSLDQAARREQLHLFRSGKTSVMVVTDVAARGIDIPLLANVVNYNMPPSARVFVHRVGRTARAGQRGWAYTLVREQDLPYAAELELFLGRNLGLAGLPRQGLEFAAEALAQLIRRDEDELAELKSVAERGERMWVKSRPAASKEAVRKAKDMAVHVDEVHPLLLVNAPEASEQAKNEMLNRLRDRRKSETVFEFKSRGAGVAAELMARRRQQIAPVQERMRRQKEVRDAEREVLAREEAARSAFYLSHTESTEAQQDRGYSFLDDATKASLSLVDEDTTGGTNGMRWDKKRGRFINPAGSDNKKYIRGEDGRKIPASLKTGRFDEWKAAHKVSGRITDDAGGHGGIVGGPIHKYRHTKDKAPKLPDKARDDYHKQRERIKKALERGVPVKGRGTPATQLRSTEDIRKLRAEKKSRVEKSNQPSRHHPKRR